MNYTVGYNSSGKQVVREVLSKAHLFVSYIDYRQITRFFTQKRSGNKFSVYSPQDAPNWFKVFSPSMGFLCLGVIWFYTTLMAYTYIRNKQILQHQKMMIYSYAACIAGVTLRLWLPILTNIFGNFITAYTIVAWLCWVPNVMVAFFITKQIELRETGT